ncbi:Glutamate receptor 3,4 [Ceratobasidium theobromae]|uniref:Glutamate receptor 3,4 n=1 Tax=Ceratobasidium theobromae TaxID=1582974 RepID=A0A5N5QE18_9AGAM|nr:Glutamate receptor 3,4 [Ceratobasidium theobromae]
MKRHRETYSHKLTYKKAKLARASGQPSPPPPPPPLPPPTDPTQLPTHIQEYDSAGSWMRPFIEPGLMLPPTPPSAQATSDSTYVSVFAPSFSASDDIILETDPNLGDELSHEREELEHQFTSAINDDATPGDEDMSPEESDEEEHEPGPRRRNRSTPADPTTFPWPDMKHFYTHVLFRSPRLGFSRAQKEAILHWGKLCGMTGVPTLSSLGKCDDHLKRCGKNPTRKFTTGMVFWLLPLMFVVYGMNKDFSNPFVRPQMVFYPTDGEGSIEEIWDGQKLAQGECPDKLTPMVISPRDPEYHYFVNEICERVSGELFIPIMFLRRQGGMWARGHMVNCTVADIRICMRVSDERILCPVEDFGHNCVDILHNFGSKLYFDDSSSRYQHFMPHPLCVQANSRIVYSIPLIIFQDDVSANRSKQWNKHHVIYMSNGALPRKELNKPANIKFVGSSPTAAPLDMMECVKQMCEETFEEPICVWDAEAECQILVRIYVHFISADNQMHVVHCSSTGLNSLLFCRTCMGGGSHVEFLTEEGFYVLFKPGAPRNLQETIRAVGEQIRVTLEGEPVSRLTSEQRKTGVKDPVAQIFLDKLHARRAQIIKSSPSGAKTSKVQIAGILRTELGANLTVQHMNPLLRMKDFDVHKDTPLEILHTVLLGALKYYWRFTCKLMDKKQTETFKIRFNSLSVSGLEMGTSNVPDYICRYPGSLTGKHFRFVVQLVPFALYDLIPAELFRVWLLLGRMTVLMWHTCIPDLDKYCDELTMVINDFLHAVAVFDPATITVKAKLHILTHAPYYVRRFGPLLGPDSERYESYNSNFRLFSVLSTRLAPSLDAARSFARVDRLIHVALGGSWYSDEAWGYVQVGSAILKHMSSSTYSQELLGFETTQLPTPGRIRMRRRRTHFASKQWADALGHLAPCPDQALNQLLFDSADELVAQNGNVIVIGSDVILWTQGQLDIGRVVMIAGSSDQNHSFVIYQPFVWLPQLDQTFHMPAVIRQETCKTVSCSDIICGINLQHRCMASHCSEAGTKVVHQERELTGLTTRVSKHGDSTQYLVNINSMTNYEHIKDLMESHTKPPTLILNPASYQSIRHAAITRLKGNAKMKVEKRRQNKKLKEALEKAGGLSDKENGGAGSEGEQAIYQGASPQSMSEVDASGSTPLTNTHQFDPRLRIPEGWLTIWSEEYQRYCIYPSLTMPFVLDHLTAAIERRRAELDQEVECEDSLPPTNNLGLDDINAESDTEVQGQEAVTGQRRSRSDSTDTPAQRRAKYARLTETTCDFYQLRGSKRVEVQDFSGLNAVEQSIVIFGLLQGVRQDLASKDAKGFGATSDFKQHCSLMVRVLLLSPTNKSYVCADFMKFLKTDVRRHFQEWRLLKSTVDEHAAFQEVIKTISNKATSERNALKSILNDAAEKGHCINRLMTELAPAEVYITEKHRARWAWILAFYKEHQKNVSEKKAKDNAFWQDIDKALHEYEEALVQRFPEHRDRASFRDVLFVDALRQYREEYPTQVPARNTPEDAADWQISLESRLARKHNYASDSTA